jgi:hypothetical protein
MRRLFRQIQQLRRDSGFVVFQNSVVHDFYDTLGQGFSKSENEVALVERMVNAAKGKRYGPVSLHGSMLHGSRSYVEFNHRDQPVTRELGDMAIIAIVTAGGERLLQKITIVQNKKASSKSWGLDQEQLFMLKNFPPFSGNRGLFKGRKDVTFVDTSGCLGSYGLLAAPGEMLFASAQLVTEFSSAKKSVSLRDIGSFTSFRQSTSTPSMPFPWFHPRFHPKEWIFLLEEWMDVMGPGAGLFHGGGVSGFLGNECFSRDLYDLIRSWTRLSVGEPTCIADETINPTVDAFSNLLLRTAGLSDLARFPPDELFGNLEFNGQMGVIAVHLEVE